MADVLVQLQPVANIWVLALQGSYVKWTRVQPYNGNAEAYGDTRLRNKGREVQFTVTGT